MIHNPFRGLILLTVFFFFGLLFHPNITGEETDTDCALCKFLPQPEEIQGWEASDPPQEYKGEDLFLYIDGGAEIYHEYGFRQVLVQDYRNQKGKSISLEIFEMSGPESAFGIYSFKTSSQGEALALGDQARLEEYYMNLWKGNFLATLTGFDEESETVEGLTRIARAVEAKMDSVGKRPTLISLLPKKGLTSGSIKYFKGNLGLYNSYPFFRKDLFAIREGIKGEYATGYSLFIIAYQSTEESLERFDTVKQGFREGKKYKNFQERDEFIQVEDSKEKRIIASPLQNRIILIVGTLSFERARQAMSEIKAEIKGK